MTSDSPSVRFLVGLDVGSTTVKAVAVDRDSGRVLWVDYQRHETRQAEKSLDFLKRLEVDVGIAPGNCRIGVTGSGASALAEFIGARVVQEVTAVTLAVERRHPDVNSIIELGGQDAKIVVFKTDPATGRKTKIASMNDKCAGGTGAVIDKIAAKLRLSPAEVCTQRYAGIRVHPVAGKCGVFAETDINSLLKAGVPADELMASLFDALVLQNLSVLTRGHTLHPHVLLLGGPNRFIAGLREAWQHQIPKVWAERHVEVPAGQSAETLITTPDNAHYFAALGAIEFAADEDDAVGRYLGTTALEDYLARGRRNAKEQSGRLGLAASPEELAAFLGRYAIAPFAPPPVRAGDTVRAFIGLDAGSTSTKAVLLSADGEVLGKSYQLSHGNPIEDAIQVLGRLREPVESSGARLEVLGVATTGYAKDILRDALQADVALVETVAHAESATRLYRDPHVVVDVGGQDIKVIVLERGRVKDFRLNTQCSAGNGYFLQATAEALGVPLDRYAAVAFSARRMPMFGYGCAVFLQSDIVGFQRDGWAPEEILAGLATVLPKNVFLYVAKIPNLARLGSRFILQGGTQRNLAVVKAEVDFIRANFRGATTEPEITVHPHCGEAGAIGAALEAHRLWLESHRTTFIGLDAVGQLTYRTTRDETTRCRFCKNACLRTFVDIGVSARPDTADAAPAAASGCQPGAPPDRRLIVATCEKGAVEELTRMRHIKAGLDAVRTANPNLVEIAAREVWKPRRPALVADPLPDRRWSPRARGRAVAMQQRDTLRIGLPRALDLYIYAPFFSGYFESLGVRSNNLVYSDYTSPQMYRAGCTRGAIDPCFPSKVALAHVHNLLFVKHTKKPLDCIFFPMVDVLHTPLMHVQASDACPTVTVTPETVKAAFTKETNLFAERRVRYLNPLLNLRNRSLLCRQLADAWGPILGLSPAENERAVDVGLRELQAFEGDIRRRAREMLDQLEHEDRLGIVVLGRSYQQDPGLNHGLLEELQKRGYPIFSESTLPLDPDLLERLFGEEVRAGVITHPLEIGDVWKNSFSASTNLKVWAAKFTARHPNLVALELSNFKCGHDAPIYAVIEAIIERSGTPYFSFKDVDENKPAGSIKIRIETIDYFLKRYREELRGRREAEAELARRLAAYEHRLRGQLVPLPVSDRESGNRALA